MAKEMNPIVKNILMIIVGVVLGSIINMGILIIMSNFIPAPEGVDIKNYESIKANIDKYEFKHFVAPWLAHALGTLVAAFTVARFAASHHKRLVLFVGLLFLVGGIMAILQIGGPTWFKVADLGLAYLPMALLGFKLGRKKEDKN